MGLLIPVPLSGFSIPETTYSKYVDEYEYEYEYFIA